MSALTTFNYFYEYLTKPRVGDKKKLPMWSPCLFDGRKVMESALSIKWMIYDIDDNTPLEALYKFREYKYIAHTSFSHSEEKNKWRLLLPLKFAIPAQEWRHAWRAGAQLWRELVGGEADPACKNSNRFYFVMGYPKEREHLAKRAINEEGEVLELKYTIPPPPKKIQTFNSEERERASRYILSAQERESIALSLGASISANCARRITCPSCGRRSLWFYIDPESTGKRSASCNHQNSCGYWSHVRSLS
jgi:hypothetical protein